MPHGIFSDRKRKKMEITFDRINHIILNWKIYAMLYMGIWVHFRLQEDIDYWFRYNVPTVLLLCFIFFKYNINNKMDGGWRRAQTRNTAAFKLLTYFIIHFASWTRAEKIMEIKWNWMLYKINTSLFFKQRKSAAHFVLF